MTRWARGGPSNKRKPEESTSWSDMNEASEDPTHHNQTNINKSEQTVKKKRKKSKKDKQTLESASVEFKKLKKAARAKKDAVCVIENLPEDESKKAPSLIQQLESIKPEPAKTVIKSSKSKHKISDISTPLAQELSKMKSETGETLTDSDKQEIERAIKKEKKREARRLERIQARDSDKVCYQCRETGHTANDCPKTKGDFSTGSGICFKCGSTEHAMQKCRINLPPGVYPYAKCFICGENGHLANKCPDNPRGLYPNGGCCKSCGSVEHFFKDCPDNLEKQGIEDIKLPLLSSSRSADEEASFFQNTGQTTKKKVPKIVKF